MPRKRWRTQLSGYKLPADGIDPNAPIRVEDHRHALVDFDELALLSNEAREQLVADLVWAIRLWRGGLKVGKVGVSDEATAQQVFLADVGRALEQADLPTKRWRKRYDQGDGPSADAPESFFFRLAREVADVAGIKLAKDLKLTGQRAIMSPAMAAAQVSELAHRLKAAMKAALDMTAQRPGRACPSIESTATKPEERRQRLDQLSRRLTAAAPALEERRRRLNELVSRLKAAAPRLHEPAGLSVV
jgi:hypothetical protein